MLRGSERRRSQPNRSAPWRRQATSERLDHGRPFSGSLAGSFAIRSAIGSRCSFAASSSIALSSANEPGVSPGAHMNDGAGVCSVSTRWLVRRFGAAYIVRPMTPACSMNSSSTAVGDQLSCENAVSVPSMFAPRRTRCRTRARWP